MRARSAGLSFACILAALPAQAATISGPTLTKALRQGGYVLVMRHAGAEEPTAENVEADNPQRERQLDAKGKAQSQAVGAAIKAAHIPIGVVLSSPTYRARETLRYAELKTPQALEQLGDGGAPGLSKASPEAATFLKAQAARMPKRGTNTLIVSHQPNIIGAFPEADGIGPDEILVLKPDGKGSDAIIARVTPGDWKDM